MSEQTTVADTLAYIEQELDLLRREVAVLTFGVQLMGKAIDKIDPHALEEIMGELDDAVTKHIGHNPQEVS